MYFLSNLVSGLQFFFNRNDLTECTSSSYIKIKLLQQRKSHVCSLETFQNLISKVLFFYWALIKRITKWKSDIWNGMTSVWSCLKTFWKFPLFQRSYKFVDRANSKVKDSILLYFYWYRYTVFWNVIHDDINL